MRIAMIVPSLANKGPVIVAKDLCEQFMHIGHICKVYYFDDIQELSMPCDTEQISIFDKIDFDSWDIVHTHGLRPDLYIRLHKSIIRKTKCRFVTTQHNPISIEAIHQTYSFVKSIVGSILWHIALTAMDEIVFLNSDTREHTNLISTIKSRVIYNGRDVVVVENIENDPHKDKIIALKKKYNIIGTISNIIKRKGLEQAISALTKLQDCALVIVGDGEDKPRLQKLAKELNVEDRCYWVGYHPQAFKYHIYFNVFIMCTRSEGFPLALIESAAYGTPTVLSNIPILTAIISKPVVEFYQLDNITDLCDKISKVLNNQQFYSRNIHRHYIQHLTAITMANNYIKLYKSLC